MTPNRRFFISLLSLSLLLVGAVAGTIFTKALLITQWNIVAPARLFSGEAPLEINSLQSITRFTTNDAEALTAIVTYYNQSEPRLAVLFNEQNPQRLRGLFAMYITHVSHFYGTPDRGYASFMDWLSLPITECSGYADNQARIMNALGLHWRLITISGGTHVFAEALIGNHYEVFDATPNVWINQPAFELERGAQRTSRSFYTQSLDERFRSSYQSKPQEVEQQLRINLPLLGVGWFAKAYFFVSAETSWQTLADNALAENQRLVRLVPSFK